VTTSEYSKRLGSITTKQFQVALDHFNLGQFISAKAIPFGLFGQNVFLTSTAGEFVLRGAAHYAWQFPEEQFVAKLLHDKTNAPVPWPYLLDTNEDIFGWKYGYVIMPRMPGLQLADQDILKSLSQQDRAAIAYAIGQNLREIQHAGWPFAGRYDHQTQTVQAFKGGFAEWLVSEIKGLLQKSFSYNTGTTKDDQAWAEFVIRDSEEALKLMGSPVLVLHDYKEANLTVEKKDGGWSVSGVFDLKEALFGDGELDLVRQLAAYMEEADLSLAESYLSGYQKTLNSDQERMKGFGYTCCMTVWCFGNTSIDRSMRRNGGTVKKLLRIG
jgi:hygromycin-B 7''-O-kinase